MTSQKPRILLVDDSPNELRILMEVLKHDYAIVAATSGEQAIQMVQEDPDIQLVLLDVNMPLKNGYETCEDLLEINSTLPILFVSGNDSTEEILKGFDVGGIDYLTKPIKTNVVSRKVDVILRQRAKLSELENEHQSASQMVMSVIATAGHLGTVLGFLRSGLKAKSHDELINELFSVFASLNMDACIQLRVNDEVINRSTNDIITPLEHNLLVRAGEMKARFLEKGSRYIVNFGSISIIVKNMPTDDDVVRGELRDHLMMILEDTDSLNRHLIEFGIQPSSNTKLEHAKSSADVALFEHQSYENIAHATDESITDDVEHVAENHDALMDIATTLDMLSEHHVKQKQTMTNIVEDMVEEFEEAFYKMGLTENQEQLLSQIVKTKTDAFTAHMEKSMEFEDALEAIQKQIKHLS